MSNGFAASLHCVSCSVSRFDRVDFGYSMHSLTNNMQPRTNKTLKRNFVATTRRLEVLQHRVAVGQLSVDRRRNYANYESRAENADVNTQHQDDRRSVPSMQSTVWRIGTQGGVATRTMRYLNSESWFSGRTGPYSRHIFCLLSLLLPRCVPSSFRSATWCLLRRVGWATGSRHQAPALSCLQSSLFRGLAPAQTTSVQSIDLSFPSLSLFCSLLTL